MKFFATKALAAGDYQVPRPQPSGTPGGQVGVGIALVLAVTVAFAGVAETTEVATAPVTARAITRLRTMTFMVFLLPLGLCSKCVKRKISLDEPDASTL